MSTARTFLLLSTLGLFVFLHNFSFAQVTLRPAQYNQYSEWDFDAKVVPTSSETVFSKDVYLESSSFTNTTGAAIVLNVVDRQSTPLALLKDVSIASGTTYVIVWGGRKCTSGLTWSASATGLVGYMRGRVSAL